ncbi:M12 family metallopeptidase [Salegentibacter sp. HM20]
MRKSRLMLLPVLVVMACSKDDVTETEVTENQLIPGETVEQEIELAYPDKQGPVTEVYYAGHKMPVEEHNGDYVYQGDILIPADMTSKQPQKLVLEVGEEPQDKSTARTSGHWPDNTVYYAIDSNLPSQNRVTDAIKHWESKTSLKFVKRTNQSNYVYFTPGSGCSSYVGMIGGRQNITLASGCSTGNTIHEIGHAIGLWHEQSRVDRNNYITIHYGNIRSGTEHNFHTYEQSGFDGDEFTSSLDYGSIMMYGPYSFSSNGKPTITKTNGDTYSVQRTSLSSGDVQGVNAIYSSGGTEPTYINGEYYTISGLTVLRANNLWYYWTKYGWKRVHLENGRWYWS